MGLEVSPMCDRLTTRVSKSQIGFIEFVVLPLFNAFSMVAPWVGERVLPQLLENKERHKVRVCRSSAKCGARGENNLSIVTG
jgi:hypothetical protein